MDRYILLMLACVALEACTIVQIQGAESVSRIYPGILSIQPRDDARVLYYKVRGIGLVPGISGTTLGFAQEETALVYKDEDCRIVIFELPKGDERHQYWSTSSSVHQNICYLGGDGQ